MIPAKPLDRAISNIKYRFGKESKGMLRFFQPPSLHRNLYLIDEWPLSHEHTMIFLEREMVTPWLMEPGGSMPHSQELSNNPFPEPNQPNFSS